MTIDDLFETCCPKQTEPEKASPELKQSEQIKPEQTAEKAGEEAEKAIEKMPEQSAPTGTEPTEKAEEKGENKNEESAE